MFGIEALDVVIGMIFIYLLFSLFVTIVNETLSSLINVRGERLFESIKELIGEDGIEELYNHPKIKVLTSKGNLLSKTKKNIESLKGKRLPEHIPHDIFGDLLSKIPNTKINGTLDELEDSIKSSKEELADLFNHAMTSASEAYKRKLRWILIGLGLLISIGFNVDSISIFKTLKDNPEVRAAVVQQATDYLEIEIATSDSSKKDSLSIAELRVEIDSLRTTQIDQLNSSLGLGWEMKQGETLVQEIWNVVSKPAIHWKQILGWLITTLALSLGAPFWFDLLKKVVNIKSEIKSTK